MSIIERFYLASPFSRIAEHTKKVHACVQLLEPLTNALLAGNYSKIEVLHNLMSKTEHEADMIKNQIRDELSKVYFMSVGKQELKEFLRMQDRVADSAEDYSVVLLLRKTVIPEALQEEFQVFVRQVIKVSESLLHVAKKLSTLADAGFTGVEAEKVLAAIDQIGVDEWNADRLQRKFSLHSYQMEDQLDPVTLNFYGKFCSTLSAVANSAERAAKFLHSIIAK